MLVLPVMKVFSGIMAIYLLVLFIIPVTDVLIAESFTHHLHNGETISYQHIHRNHQHGEDETHDYCNAFCVCDSCRALHAGILEWHHDLLFVLIPEELSKPQVSFIPVFIPDFPTEVWQPPKIVS